ncbi:MAG: alpha/beta hydrolase [Pseudonocardiaceae bacterium]
MSSRLHRAVRATTALLAAAALTGTLSGTAPAAPAPPEPARPDLARPEPSVVPGGYADQTITWRPCFPDGPPASLPPGSERLECGSFTAPRDWADSAGTTITIAVSRLRASGNASGAAGALFTNPGGPGGAGRFVPLLFLLADRQRVLQSQDIYGIDVRGTGGSTSTNCNGGAETGVTLDPRDRSRANTDLILDSAALVARFCQNGTGEFGPFVRTDETVQDLDLLRRLIGQEKINWLGYSAGTWVGAHYATYFPQRVGRFVLDANVGFTDPWQAAIDLQPLGFQRRYEQDFLPWAATYDSILHLGSSPPQVNRTYEDVRAALAAEPLDLGQGIVLYAADFDALIVGALYSKLQFQSLAELIGFIRDETAHRTESADSPPVAARARELVQRMRALRAHSGSIQPLAPDYPNATLLHIACNDTPASGDREALLAGSQQQGQKYPLVGWATLANPCLTWNRPGVTLRTPDGAGVPPVLMVQNDHDPATPIEGALRARDAFAGARLLTVTGEGDHTTYAASAPNDCVNDVVEDYLVDGVVPARDSSCPGVPIPPPSPGPLLPLPGDGATGTPQQLIAALTALAGPR